MILDEKLRRVALWRALRRGDDDAAAALTADLSYEDTYTLLVELAMLNGEVARDCPDEVLDFVIFIVHEGLVADVVAESRVV